MASVPPSEACLYDQIKWNLAQVQQQPSFGLSQSLASAFDGKKQNWLPV